MGARLLKATEAACTSPKLFTSTNVSNHPMQLLATPDQPAGPPTHGRMQPLLRHRTDLRHLARQHTHPRQQHLVPRAATPPHD
ncbi:hypothetical protein GCM10010234_74200 [Streptomyces hawaiiensis]